MSSTETFAQQDETGNPSDPNNNGEQETSPTSSQKSKSPGGTSLLPRCDICGYREGRHGMKMIRCKDCGVRVHRDCYGMPTYIKDEFTCWACDAVGRTFNVHVKDGKDNQLRKVEVTQSTRPTRCDLCGHHDDAIHAMHPVYDNYGPRARQLHVPDNTSSSGRRLVWAHTVCGFFLCTQNCMYAVSQEGTTHEGLEDDNRDDRSINPELQLDDEEDEEEDLYDGFAPSHHFVYYVPKERHGEIVHTSRSRDIMNKQQLKCEICKLDDTGKDVYRIPVQCSAGERTELRKHRVKHTDLDLDKGETCTRAFHVGCARYSTTQQEHRRVFYFPGLPDNPSAKPERCIYCPPHAADLNKKEQSIRQQQQDEQFHAHKAKRKLAMAQKYGRALTLSSPSSELLDTPPRKKDRRDRNDDDDSSALTPLERVKRDLAAKVIHISQKEGKAWILEQKKLWAKKLSEKDLKAVWKPAKKHAFDVWAKHNNK